MQHHITAPDTDNFLRHLIGGDWVDGQGPVTTTTNPSDETTVAEYHQADTRLLDAAVSAAVSARRDWDDRGIIARGLVLRRAAEILAERADAIAELMTREQGKTLPESRAEVGATVETLYYHAAQARNPDGATYPSSHPDEVIRTVRRPLGVVAAITPWNFPLQIPAWKLAPALLWGNTVVWKPASDTVAIAAAFAEVLAAAGVPAGVLNMILGPGPIGAELVAREEISGVTFTGSVPVGRSIQAAAVPRGAKVQMELGGHNAAIVLPDVDPHDAAAVLIAGAMGSTGQKCTATRRIIAVGDAYDALVPRTRRPRRGTGGRRRTGTGVADRPARLAPRGEGGDGRGRPGAVRGRRIAGACTTPHVGCRVRRPHSARRQHRIDHLPRGGVRTGDHDLACERPRRGHHRRERNALRPHRRGVHL